MACIVVIEDEPHHLRLAQDVLEREGYAILSISRPEHITEALRHARPDAFLIDIMLAGKSGIDIARDLRKEGFPHTPMIAMSASPSMASYARQSGVFQDTIDKPFDIDVLLATVARHTRAAPPSRSL